MKFAAQIIKKLDLIEGLKKEFRKLTYCLTKVLKLFMYTHRDKYIYPVVNNTFSTNKKIFLENVLEKLDFEKHSY